MDISLESDPNSKVEILVLSSYGKNFECYVRERYLKNIFVVHGIYRATIPSAEFSSECLFPIEVSDLLSYLGLETSYNTNNALRPWKVWMRTTRWFLVWLHQFEGNKSRAKLLWPKREIRSEWTILLWAFRLSQLSSGKIFWKLLIVKQQTGIQDLATVHLF